MYKTTGRFEMRKSGGGQKWGIMELGAGAPDYCHNGGYTTKKAAEADLAVAQAVVAFFRAATAPLYTALDYLAFDTAREVVRAHEALERKLNSARQDAERDLERLRAGMLPWHSPGSWARSATDIDQAHATCQATWKQLRDMVWAAQQMDPTSYAAVAGAVAWAFASLAGVR